MATDCRSEEALENVESFSSLILILITMHLSCTTGDFILSLFQPVFKTFTLHLGVKKINNLSYLAVNALIKFLNCTFYTAQKKETIAPKICTENLFYENSLMTVQHEKTATRRKCNMKRDHYKTQHKNSATLKRATWKTV